MSINKLLPGNETILLIPAIEINGVPQLVGDTIAPIDLPTAAILNTWIPVTSESVAGSGAGGNVSCAMRDDLTLGLTDSDTDDDRTPCSVGQADILTFFNFEAEFTIFRDENRADSTSEFNMAVALTRAADVPYIIAHRIGYKQDEPAAIGQEWDFYYAWTDNPVPVYDDGGNQLQTATFIPKNLVETAHTLTV